jgi:hypothetical protein
MLRRWRLDLECLGSWAAPESLEIFTSPASVAYPREPRGHERFFLLRRRRPGGFERFRWGRGQVGFSGGQQMNQRYTTGGQKESEDPSRLSRRHRRHLRRRPWMAVDRSLLPVSCHAISEEADPLQYISTYDGSYWAFNDPSWPSRVDRRSGSCAASRKRRTTVASAFNSKEKILRTCT